MERFFRFDRDELQLRYKGIAPVMRMGLGGALILSAIMMRLLLQNPCEPILPYVNALGACERLLMALCAPLLPKRTSLTEALKQQFEFDEEAVAHAVTEYAMRLNRQLKRSLAEEIASALVDAAMRNGVDACLLAAVVARESSFRCDARSPSGAVGLAQLMPQTAAALGVVDPHDIAQNLDGAARYLATLMRRWCGRDDAVEMALASYRLGPRLIELRLGIPDVAGVASYLDDVLNHYIKLRSLVRREKESNCSSDAEEGRR
ncbi:MAG: lytic transglycosylase domain-containing protein [Armatimonadota bacterium]|nr:lytic transglycosylase domain-containing protein [Armatimonadota bacterium]MCX7777109.1 lytic transglycosylase domain-containing protein [Armatimonadota bacterium]MDW8025156.1 lytic transglycosylase domain-containing protein [Armatimonadota bacterium]